MFLRNSFSCISKIVGGMSLSVLAVFANADVDARATVATDATGMSVSAPGAIHNYAGMTLNIAGPGGGVETTNTSGSHLYWSSAGAVDGLHRYTVHVALSSDGGSDAPLEEPVQTRTSGSFYVSSGEVMQEPEALLLRKPETGWTLAGVMRSIGSFFISGAYAQDLTVDSTIPTINFDDTSIGAGRVWQIETFDSLNDSTGTADFELEFRGDGVTEVIDIRTDEDGDQSLVIDDAGDITLANGVLFIDRSTDIIGIGTSTPNNFGLGLHIAGGTPGIRLESTTSTNAWENWVGQSTGGYYLYDVTGNNTALFVTDEEPGGVNYFGFGFSSPSARLHVMGNSATEEDVQIRVENQNTAEPGIARKLFQIVNDGPAKFSMFSSDTDEWAFNARDNEFRISKQGSGNVEMELSDTGNLTITGTLTQGSSRAIKQDIERVDVDQVLAKVVSLPISEWSYKTDGSGVRHLGPMAEDFYASFKLGHTEKGLTSVDTSGVALAAIKGLKIQKDQELAEKDEEITALKQQLSDQEERMIQLELVVGQLMSENNGLLVGAVRN